MKFDCKNSSNLVVSAINRLDQTTTCGLLAGEALYLEASGGKDGTSTSKPVVPPPPSGVAAATPEQIPVIIATAVVTAVLLLVIILCGVFINRKKQ
jgi:hypothetical protein